MTELRTKEREEEQLSTADMAAAGSRPNPPVDGTREIQTPPEARGTPEMAPHPVEPHAAPLFPEQEARELRERWDAIQTAFVDNPRQAVEQADHLVAQTIKRLAEMFANERNQLEQQWSRGDNASTEDLRVALQRYRSFFGRLLSI
jgi:hypothetical protein